MTRHRSGERRRRRTPWLLAMLSAVPAIAAILTVPGRPVFAAASPAAGIIETYLGGGSGDGGPALTAALPLGGGPGTHTGLAQDPAGDIYFTEYGLNVVRRISTSGVVTTVAGVPCVSPSCNAAVSGDGGPATAAGLVSPQGLAFDGKGNLYISGGGTVRRVDPGGVISTFVGGTGPQCVDSTLVISPAAASPAADQLCLNEAAGIAFGPDGSLYIAEMFNDDVLRVDADPGSDGKRHVHIAAGAGTCSFDAGQWLYGAGFFSGDCGDGGPATQAGLHFPADVAVDRAGVVYIADGGHNAVRFIDRSGVMHTLLGTGAASSSGDGGPASFANVNLPSGLTLGADGLYVADSGGSRVRKVRFSDQKVSTVAGTPTRGYSGEGIPGYATDLNYPAGLLMEPSGSLLIADTGNNLIRRMSATTGAVTTVGGNGGGCSMTRSDRLERTAFCSPTAITVDPASGAVYVVDRSATSSNYGASVAWSSGVLVRVDRSGRETAAAGNLRPVTVGSVSATCQPLDDGHPAAEATLCTPGGAAIDHAGNLYIADSGNQRIRRVDAVTGIISTYAGSGTQGFSQDGGNALNAKLALDTTYQSHVGVVVDGHGDVYFSDIGNNRVRRIHNGIITTVAGNGVQDSITTTNNGDGGAATDAIVTPVALALDSAGNLYISEQGRVRKVSGGIITTVAGSPQTYYTAAAYREGSDGDGGAATKAQLGLVSGLAFDTVGNLYIVDKTTARVRRIDAATGVITTVAGGGPSPVYVQSSNNAYCGDGGVATEACLYNPDDVAWDHGVLYIADTGNGRVREVGMPASGGHTAAPGGGGGIAAPGHRRTTLDCC